MFLFSFSPNVLTSELCEGGNRRGAVLAASVVQKTAVLSYCIVQVYPALVLVQVQVLLLVLVQYKYSTRSPKGIGERGKIR